MRELHVEVAPVNLDLVTPKFQWPQTGTTLFNLADLDTPDPRLDIRTTMYSKRAERCSINQNLHQAAVVIVCRFSFDSSLFFLFVELFSLTLMLAVATQYFGLYEITTQRMLN